MLSDKSTTKTFLREKGFMRREGQRWEQRKEGAVCALARVIARTLSQGTVFPRCLGPEKEPLLLETGFNCSGRRQDGRPVGDTSVLFPLRLFLPTAPAIHHPQCFK